MIFYRTKFQAASSSDLLVIHANSKTKQSPRRLPFVTRKLLRKQLLLRQHLHKQRSVCYDAGTSAGRY